MRILIDCTAINLHAKPLTGIPRVVQNQLLFGYTFGAERGIEVLPVAVCGGKLVLQRPSSLFPHPQTMTGIRSRERVGPLLALVVHYLLVGIGYALFALPWSAVYLGRRLRGQPARPAELSDKLSGVLDWLQKPAGFFWRRYMLSAPVEPQNDDILFSPAYWHDVAPDFYAGLRDKLAAQYVLVHDVIPVSHPQMYLAPWRDHFRENVRAALHNFSAVITISHYTANMIRQLYEAEAEAATISVCHNGLEPLAPSQVGPTRFEAHFQPDRRPYLMVGTIEPKKGHLLVLQALERMWDDGRSQRPLVIMGRKGWMYDDIVIALKSTRHRDKVIWIQDASDAELSHAYRNAHLLIHASTVEGFGLPLVECASFGTPVVANWSEIAQEVLGQFGVFFDNAADDLTYKLLEFEKPGRMARQRALMAEFGWPLWQDVVPALFSALCDAAQDGKPLPEEIIAGPLVKSAGDTRPSGSRS